MTEDARQQVERLLEGAEVALEEEAWEPVNACADEVLALQPESGEARRLRRLAPGTVRAAGKQERGR